MASLGGLISYSSDNSDDGEEQHDTSFEEKENHPDDDVESKERDDECVVEISSIESRYPLLSQFLGSELIVRELTTNHQQHEDVDITTILRAKKEFGNPYILTEIVKQLNIDEIGSNYPKHLFDPRGYAGADFSDQILKRYSRGDFTNKTKNDKKADPQSGDSKEAASAPAKKRSRWDQQGSR